MSEERQAARFSWSAWAVGVFVAILSGFILNVIVGMFAMSTGARIAVIAVGFVPGAILIVLGFLARQALGSFAYGLLTGGCVVALIGGACGAALSS
jgi:hypothetical protein